MGNEPVKRVQTAAAMTTLGIASNGKPVTTDTIDSQRDTNFLYASFGDVQNAINKYNAKGISPFGQISPYQQKLTSTKTEPAQKQIKEQVEAQAAQISNPSVKNIIKRWGKDLISNITKYDQVFNGGKIANQIIPPESDLYDAAASNGRIQAILYKMQREMC